MVTRRLSQPMLLILGLAITSSWTFATTEVTYAGVAVTRPQLVQLKQLVSAEATWLTTQSTMQRSDQSQAIHTAAMRLVKRSSMVIEPSSDDIQTILRHDYKSLMTVNWQAVRQLTRSVGQQRQIVRQLMHDAGTSYAKVAS
ncbi:hypothetical protein [Lactiplantibacillus daowaiensis]|uniref:Extracellular protein n=1 Tax=Lactiplantibacillus daowaiensis TaxID=2559918 RepID=A0ABW1RWT2_9LACO|nr:hypothetical protein [Lactiplantibacillus daowaiensis]